ncbi:hypothetical protein C9374_005608 [Naegleria lovaniensis]|uniref:F-box domain-containing protein n=1 Tax=Naegleria lovaniensis TaxID=51637 RepID=A0AA88GNG4_NAELO|nr:uncharacterized protein C9374_005608 [Naegleria lovaniensis]KAG2382406.1 hypothetical protein C9374_005608 [Naegleria lovaniensis]
MKHQIIFSTGISSTFDDRSNHSKRSTERLQPLASEIPTRNSLSSTKSNSSSSLQIRMTQHSPISKYFNGNRHVDKKRNISNDDDSEWTSHELSTTSSTTERLKSCIYTLSDLQSEILIQILMFLTPYESASLMLTNSSMCEQLLQDNGFFKLLYIQWITSDISQAMTHLEQRVAYNRSKFKFDCRLTYFNALGISQWKQWIQKKQIELKKHLHRTSATMDWHKIFRGYYCRSQYEKIRLKLASISKLCRNNPNALVLVFKLFRDVKRKLQNLPSNTEREYIIKRNYGKRIKRDHTLVHQCFYLMGDFSQLKYQKEEMDQLIPFLNYFVYSSRNVSENPLIVKNSWNLTAFHYAIRVGSNHLLRELSTTFFGDLKACTLLRLTEEPQKAPIVFHLVKYNIYPAMLKEWIQMNLCKPEVFLSKAREDAVRTNFLHYMMQYGTKSPRTIIGYLSLIKEVFSSQQIEKLVNEQEEGETLFAYTISLFTNLINSPSDFGKIFGILNYLCVEWNYTPSQNELDRWNQLLENYRMTHTHSKASQLVTKFKIDLDSIQLRRLMQQME